MTTITEFQYQILCEAQNGVITYAQARGNGRLQQVHRLTANGILEYVPAEKHLPGSWRLTELGLALLPCPLDHTPNATTIKALEEADAGAGTIYEGTTEDIFEKILSEPDDDTPSSDTNGDGETAS